MTTKVVMYDQYGVDVAQARSVVEQTRPEVSVTTPTAERLTEELKSAEIFFGYHSPEVFRDTPALRWIQSTSAGMDALLVPELAKRDLFITNASGIHAPQVAEMAWALTLSVSRGMLTFARQQQEHRWEWGTQYDLDGMTAGVVGLGGIGRRYARVAAAFGMRVLAVDPQPLAKPEEVEALWNLDRLDELLEVADFVLIACPATAETQSLIDRKRLARMKSTAILVNIARGGIVDEDALSEALRDGRLAGAGLDVCKTEPLPPESPLWDVPNLVITPHCAGLSPGRTRRLTEFFCENLRRYFDGEPLRNVVDREKGYPTQKG